MLYMVFADTDRYVFDWDWVLEDPETPGHPLNMELRFGNPVQESRELVLDLPDHLVSWQIRRDEARFIAERATACSAT